MTWRLMTSLLFVAGCAQAQWIHWPTPGVPRTADGRLDKTAKTPRTPDGKPDFSGMWWLGGKPRPCPDSIGGQKDCAEKGLGLPDQGGSDLGAQTINITDGVDVPYQPWVRDLLRTRLVVPGKDDPHVRCLPSSLPRLYTLPHLQKFIQTPTLLVLLNEFNASYRQIHLDGRPLPEDPIPTWVGYSTAHWDGDTLVVETNGFRDDLWLDMFGTPLTDQAKITERITRPNFGSLHIDMTFDDPKAYTKPWTIEIDEFLVVDTEMMDEYCLEGEKSVIHLQNQK
jgi:hypothetical protein